MYNQNKDVGKFPWSSCDSQEFFFFFFFSFFGQQCEGGGIQAFDTFGSVCPMSIELCSSWREAKELKAKEISKVT